MLALLVIFYISDTVECRLLLPFSGSGMHVQQADTIVWPVGRALYLRFAQLVMLEISDTVECRLLLPLFGYLVEHGTRGLQTSEITRCQ